MTKAHTPDQYKDGHSMVAFCKVCGAEGLRLLHDCQGNVIHTFSASDLEQQELDLAIDATKQTAK